MSNRKILQKSFFEKPATEVAKNLLGKFLVRRVNGHNIAVMITEVEAYDGFKDKASHASRGKTKRNEPMFGPAGHWYVYLCYGVHSMLNIVTGPKDYPAAILIRGVLVANGSRHPITQILKPHVSGNRMSSHRAFPKKQIARLPKTRDKRQSIFGSSEVILRMSGPGKLTKFLKIDKKLNGKEANKKTGLWIAAPSRKERALPRKKFGAGRLKIYRGPRIGVDYAGPVWSKKHYRFWIRM